VRTIDKFVLVGSTLKVHGINGLIRVRVNPDYLDSFFDADFIFLDLNGSKVPFFVNEINDGDSLNVLLEHINRPEDAIHLVPADIYLPATEAEKTNEDHSERLEFERLIGFTVFSQEQKIGEILNVVAYPQQEMAIVSYQDTEIFIPLHHELIETIHPDTKEIKMRLPEGLLDLA
jgi:16S rRNA processing protein RimM